MKIFDIKDMKPPAAEAAIFQGFQYGASVSFFVVEFSSGKGPNRHRHPYEETFIILHGDIEFIVDSKPQTLGSGQIAIVPASTWHEFKNRSDQPSLMVNIHPVPQMITEWA